MAIHHRHRNSHSPRNKLVCDYRDKKLYISFQTRKQNIGGKCIQIFHFYCNSWQSSHFENKFECRCLQFFYLRFEITRYCKFHWHVINVKFFLNFYCSLFVLFIPLTVSTIFWKTCFNFEIVNRVNIRDRNILN